MKFLVLLSLSFFSIADAKNLAEEEGACVNCESRLVANKGVGNGNISTLAGIDQAISGSVIIGSSDQYNLCYQFLRNGFTSLKNEFKKLGSSIEIGYAQVKCEDGRRDLIKHRQLNAMGRSDLAAFILYYKRDLNREADLPKIFNAVTPGPRVPNGTLIDFIEYYRNMEDMDDYSKGEYEKMITLLRRYGAKKASEL